MTTETQPERQREHLGQTSNGEVGGLDRWLSLAGGGTLAALGVYRRGRTGIMFAVAGASLVARGITRRDPVYRLLGLNTANGHGSPSASVRHKQGIRVARSVSIQRSADVIYRFWHDFENLPRFMDHLESVQVTGDGRSHWVAKAPAGRTVEWDAEIINEQPNELIAWRSVEGSEIGNAGSVRFTPGAADRGTQVVVELEYAPPAGPLGALVAKLFGEEPEIQVREDLRRFKELLEAGEVATTTGQPSGRQ